MAKEFLIDRAQSGAMGPHPANKQEWAMSVKVGISLLRAAELKGIRNLPVRPEKVAGPISTQITAKGVSAQLETFLDEEHMRGIYILGKAINSIVDTESQIISSRGCPSGLVELKGRTEQYFDQFRPIELDNLEVIK